MRLPLPEIKVFFDESESLIKPPSSDVEVADILLSIISVLKGNGKPLSVKGQERIIGGKNTTATFHHFIFLIKFLVLLIKNSAILITLNYAVEKPKKCLSA